jgi:hypothetical protein
MFFKKYLLKLVNKEIEKRVSDIKEELEKDVLKKQVEILKMALTSKGNVKPLHDTVLFIDYYFSIEGLSPQQAEKLITDFIGDCTINDEFVRSMGLKQIHQHFVCVNEGKTRIEYQLV